jgi:P4 family phage/plasmid primase-like protien
MASVSHPTLVGYLTARGIPFGYLRMRERFDRTGKWRSERIQWLGTGDVYRQNCDWAATTRGNRDLGDARHTPRPDRPVAGKTAIDDQTYLAYTTRDFYILDVDDLEVFQSLYPTLAKSLAADCPHYLSRNKRYPHYIVRVSDFPKNRYSKGSLKRLHKMRGGAGELLTGQGTWVRPCDATGPLLNGDKPPMTIRFGDLTAAAPGAPAVPEASAEEKHTLYNIGEEMCAVQQRRQNPKARSDTAPAAVKAGRPTRGARRSSLPTPSAAAMAELLRIVDAKRFLSPRDTWLKIGTALRKAYGDRDGFALFDRASQRAPEKYDGEAECRRQFLAMSPAADVGIGTIIHYARESDASAVEAWKSRHAARPRAPAASGDHIDEICRKRGIPRDVFDYACADNFEQLLADDLGLANIYFRLAGADTKMTDTSGDGTAFIWDNAKRLWRVWKPAFVKVKIQHTVLPVALAALDAVEYNTTRWKAELRRPGIDGDYKQRLERDIKSSATKRKAVKQAISRCRSTRFASGIMAQVQLACYDEEFVTTVNKSPHELPTRGGGVIDLRTGETRPRTRDDLWSFELAVSCDHEGAADDVRDALRLVQSICCEYGADTTPLTEYLLQVLGYSMTGMTTERHFYVLHGHGRNGKSTLMDCMKGILGEFYAQLSDAVFLDQGDRGSATPELMCLLTARLGVLSETKKDADLDPKRVKELTGNDTISGRHLYKDQITFKPYATYILMTNFLPRYDARDQAMTDRIRLIPFSARFEDTPENKAFVGRFKEQGALDEVFRLLVWGATEYFRNGKVVDPPQRAKAAMASYTSDLDILGQFLATCQTDPDEDGKPRRWKRSECFAAFREFAEKEGAKGTRDCPLLNRRHYYSALEKAGFSDRKVKGTRYICGIGPATGATGTEGAL